MFTVPTAAVRGVLDLTLAGGSTPLILAFGAGVETSTTTGTVISDGVLLATLITIFLIPVAYLILIRGAGSPETVARQLFAEEQRTGGSAEND